MSGKHYMKMVYVLSLLLYGQLLTYCDANQRVPWGWVTLESIDHIVKVHQRYHFGCGRQHNAACSLFIYDGHRSHGYRTEQGVDWLIGAKHHREGFVPLPIFVVKNLNFGIDRFNTLGRERDYNNQYLCLGE